MDKNKLYGSWYIWEELVSYPMMLYYWIKGDKIKKLLSERIKNAKQRAEQEVLTEKTKNEFLIEYEKLDNFFSYHFKQIDKSRSHNFQEKINYCVQQYKTESSKHFNSSSLMKLQGNFLNGAENTLFLYFTLDRKVKREIRLSDIMIGENPSNILIYTF